MNRTFQQSYFVSGTLARDLNVYFKAHSNLTLQHVSLSNSSGNAPGIKIGTSGDDDEFLALKSGGISNTPVEFERDDFVGGQYPRIEDGDIVQVQIDYDYNDGDTPAASADVAVVLTFAEG